MPGVGQDCKGADEIGGAVSRRVVILDLPNPLTTLFTSVQIGSSIREDQRAYIGKKVVTFPADVKPYVVARRSQAFGSLEVISISEVFKGRVREKWMYLTASLAP